MQLRLRWAGNSCTAWRCFFWPIGVCRSLLRARSEEAYVALGDATGTASAQNLMTLRPNNRVDSKRRALVAERAADVPRSRQGANGSRHSGQSCRVATAWTGDYGESERLYESAAKTHRDLTNPLYVARGMEAFGELALSLEIHRESAMLLCVRNRRQGTRARNRRGVRNCAVDPIGSRPLAFTKCRSTEYVRTSISQGA